jgi:hypothetical protein
MTKLTTSVTELTELTSEQLFEDFTRQFSKQDLFDEAEKIFRTYTPRSDIHTFLYRENGLMGYTIGMILQVSLDSEVVGPSLDLETRLMDHYKFLPETVPPRIILTQLLASGKKFLDLLEALQENFPVDLVGTTTEQVILMEASGLDEPGDAYDLDVETLEDILQMKLS